MPSTQPSDLNPQVSLNSPKRIWIVNPFDQLPNESDVQLRYWALCRTFAEQGHEVIWWSSDFSHLTKSKRSACPDIDGFAVRLIETPPYTKNISLARLKNHKAFADGFYRDAMAGLKSGELKAPDRIVVSLPPLGVAEQAFRIRDALRECKSKFRGAEQQQDRTRSGPDQVGTYESQRGDPEPSHINTFSPSNPSIAGTPSNLHTQRSCQVIVDIMDAWPETFYQALPKLFRKSLGPLLLARLHRSAKRAYRGADKISAVGQSYLDLAQKYLSRSDTPVALDNTKQATGVSLLQTPTHLCYHGTDLSRFRRDKSESEAVKSESAQGTEDRRQETEDRRTAPPSHNGGHKRKQKSSLNKQQATSNKQRPTNTPLPTSHSSLPSKLLSAAQPLKAVYLGSMGSGYDLGTIIEVAARWKAEDIFPFQIHFAGDGPQREALEARATQLGLTSPQSSVINHQSSKQPATLYYALGRNALLCPWVQPPPASSARIVFHGHLGKTPITVLLESSDLALVPNRPGSLVACPYKAGEYAAAGLPMVSCLGGELGDLLKTWNAGSEYSEGDTASLQAAFKNYSTDVDLLKQQSLNAGKMAEALFDRSETYQQLAEFIMETDE
jgi:glycosyltransferase involved in cell wall biosynthesis